MGNPSDERVWLRLDLDADPLDGELVTDDGVAHPFTGWVGLVCALEAERGRRRERESSREDRAG